MSQYIISATMSNSVIANPIQNKGVTKVLSLVSMPPENLPLNFSKIMTSPFLRGKFPNSFIYDSSRF